MILFHPSVARTYLEFKESISRKCVNLKKTCNKVTIFRTLDLFSCSYSIDGCVYFHINILLLLHAVPAGVISFMLQIVLYHPQNTHNFHFSKCNINHAEYYAPPPAGQRYPYLLKYSYRAF